MSSCRLMAGLALCGALCSPLLAQQPGKIHPPLPVGEEISGEYSPVDWYSLRVPAGQRMFIRATSEFDNVLQLRSSAGDLLLENDDFAGTDAGLFYRSADGETVMVGVSAYTGEEGGPFKLKAYPLEEPVALAPGGARQCILREEEEFLGMVAHEYVVHLEKPSHLTLQLESSDFDTYLYVVDANWVIHENDDAMDGTDSMVSAFFPAGAVYVIATSFDRESSGAYTVKVSQPEKAVPLAVGTTRGSLAEGSSGRMYALPVKQDHRYQVDLMSEDFDAYLEINLPDGTLLEDDDGGDDLNSRLVFTATEGDANIMVREAFQSGIGAYTLSVRELGRVERRAYEAGQELKAGDQFVVRMDDTAPQQEGYYYHSYLLTVPEGGRATVRHNSADFDAVLVARGPDGEEQMDDDGGDDTNSLLVLQGRDDGPYTLEFSSFDEGATGEYEVVVQMLGAPQVLLDEKGRLTADSQTDDEGKHLSEYVFEGTAGSNVQIELRSSDFDAYLYLYGPDGGLIAEDDDGLSAECIFSTTDAMVFIPLPENGQYRVVATGYSQEDSLGEYHLIIRQYPTAE